MRFLTIFFFATFGSSAVSQSLTDTVFASWLGEIDYAFTICGSVELTDAKRSELLSMAGIEADRLARGGDLFSAYMTANVNSHDKFAANSPSDTCYHLKQALGPDGFVASGFAN